MSSETLVWQQRRLCMTEKGLLPYENLSGTAAVKSVVRADEALECGWSHRGRYAALPYGNEWPWFDDLPGNSSRNFHLHAWDMLNDVLMAHSHTGDPRYYDVAVKVALDWISHFGKWEVAGQPQYAWYDMAVGLRAQRLAYVLDAGLRFHSLDAEHADVMSAALEQHRIYLERDENIVFGNNHGFYQVVGQLAMARRFREGAPCMEAASVQGEQRLRRMIEAQFTEDGIHREHSPDYHRMVYQSLRGVVAEGLVKDPGLSSLILRIEEALMWFVTPDSTLARFGDSDERKLIYKESDANRLWITKEMRYMTSQGRSGEPPRFPPIRGFEQSGYFMARDGWPTWDGSGVGEGYLAKMCAFHSRAHKHADDLSIIWYEYGRQILVDAGRYGYFGKAEPGSALWEDGYWYSHPARVYVESTRAHNTVEIDGRNHPRKGVKPYGSALRRHGKSDDGLIYAESEVRHGGVRFIRTLAWLPGEWLLVWDWLGDAKSNEHDYVQWFHFPVGSVVTTDGSGTKVAVPGIPGNVGMIDLLGPGQDFVVQEGLCDAVGHPLQGFHSPSEKTLVPNPALGVKRGGAQAVYLTLLALKPVSPDSVRVNMSPRGWRGS